MNFNFNQFLKSALVVVFIWLTIDTNAQSAYEGIRYQAILRDGSGSIISGQNVSLRMTIYQKGDLVNGYIETHETFTNIMGLINLTIGNGIPIQNTFSNINWGKSTSNPFFIKIEFSDNDGNTFLTFGESQLLSVPYAMYAKNVENVNDADANPLNEIQDLSLSGNILEISMNSASTLIDLSPYLDNTDAQVLSFGLDDTLHLTSGGKVYLGIYDIDTRFKAHIAQYTLDQSALALRLQNLSDSAATNYSTGISNSASIQNDSARLNQAKNDLKNTQDSVSVLYSAAFKDSSSTNEIQNILINVSNDSLLISDGQGIALNKLFEAASIAIDSLEDAYNDTNKNLFLGAKPNNLVKSGVNRALNNVGVGTDALVANTSGSYNVGVGTGALYENTTGDNNIALGQEALSANKVGNGNTAIGRFALRQATANGNTAIGPESSGSNTTGQFNTSVGRLSLRSNKTGTNNSALGAAADVADTNLTYATAIGSGAIVKASNTIQLGNSSIDSVVTSGKLKLGNVIYPNTDGTTGQVLATDGSGNLSFQTTNTSSLVPYLGATQAVNLDTFDLTVNGLTIGQGKVRTGSNTAFGFGVLGNIVSTNFLVGTRNTAVGTGSMQMTTTGFGNTAIGWTSLQNNTTGDNNTALGYSALRLNTTGSANTATGYGALSRNTTGDGNTASGYEALQSNTTGYQNTASGTVALQSNTTGYLNAAIGPRAMQNTTTGNNNVAFGNQALQANKTGSGNTAIGSIADVADSNLTYATAIGFGAIVKASNTIQLGNGSIDSVVTSGKLKLGNVIYPNTDGTTGQVLTTDGSGNLSFQTTNTSSLVPYLGATQAVNLGAFDLTVNSVKIGLGSGNVATNIALGNGALRSNTTGNNNTAIGSYALETNTTGSYNTASGTNALNKNTIGRDNTALGFNALLQNTTGSDNTASGAFALNANTTGIRNTASGTNALNSNTTGSNNTASGYNALNSNTTGAGNTAAGFEALKSNTTGNNNTASGYRALNKNTTGSENTASGNEALYSNTTGNTNTAIGWQSLYRNSSGYNNTALGWRALHVNTAGRQNTAIGYQAIKANTTGRQNTATGFAALEKNTTGNDNTAIGYGAGVTTGALNNTTAIGHSAQVSSSNTIQLGNGSIDSVVTSGKLKLGDVIYPNTDGTVGQFLQTNGNGNLTWGAPMPNVIRSIVIAPGMFPTEAFSGSTTKKSIVGGSGLPVIEMGDNVSGQIAMSVPLPSDWVAGTAVKIKLLYSNVTNSGNISFRFGSAKLAENSTTITGTSSSTVSLNVSSTAYGLKEYSHSISMNSTEKVLHFFLRRQGTNSADTNSGVMYIHGVNIEYTGK
ncbi:hypothetical protein N8833_00460 [Salibacteraceae bacterium]|nr:hypothetical protein [Salibacteraceae bacterium]